MDYKTSDYRKSSCRSILEFYSRPCHGLWRVMIGERSWVELPRPRYITSRARYCPRDPPPCLHLCTVGRTTVKPCLTSFDDPQIDLLVANYLEQHHTAPSQHGLRPGHTSLRFHQHIFELDKARLEGEYGLDSCHDDITKDYLSLMVLSVGQVTFLENLDSYQYQPECDISRGLKHCNQAGFNSQGFFALPLYSRSIMRDT